MPSEARITGGLPYPPVIYMGSGTLNSVLLDCMASALTLTISPALCPAFIWVLGIQIQGLCREEDSPAPMMFLKNIFFQPGIGACL